MTLAYAMGSWSSSVGAYIDPTGINQFLLAGFPAFFLGDLFFDLSDLFQNTSQLQMMSNGAKCTADQRIGA